MKEVTGMSELNRDVLLITEITDAKGCGSALAGMLGCTVEVAGSRREGLGALHRREFGAVLVDDNMAEADPDWADQLWGDAGMAMPLRVNYAISSVPRLAREVKNALMRREGEQAMARRVVTAQLENELKGSVTGLLLQSQLALREAAGSIYLEPKLRSVVELAGELRMRLRGAGA